MMDIAQARDTQLSNIAAASGTPLEEWFARIEARRAGGAKHGQLVGWLKDEYALTHGNANALVHASADHGAEPIDLVAAQYSGAKAGLRPLYDALITAVRAFGDDVEVAPKKTCVSLRRAKQFAVLTPATRTRVDIGVNLGDQAAEGVLESATGMCTHRIRVSEPADVDDTVIGWLRDAYGRA